MPTRSSLMEIVTTVASTAKKNPKGGGNGKGSNKNSANALDLPEPEPRPGDANGLELCALDICTLEEERERGAHYAAKASARPPCAVKVIVHQPGQDHRAEERRAQQLTDLPFFLCGVIRLGGEALVEIQLGHWSIGDRVPQGHV